jgi:DNA-binding beta-propeller fold protein YncE
VRGARGIAASPVTHRLYVSFGGDGGPAGHGSLLAYDLVRHKVVWRRDYATGIDSMAVTPDGKGIYMPQGELSPSSNWTILDGASGKVRGTVAGGLGPHNTIVGLDGRYAYLGGRNADFLTVVSTRTNRVVRRLGPLKHGVRPFTIDASQRYAFTTATGFLGFQVSSISSGRVLYTVPVRGFSYDPATFAPTAPSHGISLSPDGRRLFLIDAPNDAIHVYDVSGLPSVAPSLLRTIRLVHGFSGDESSCAYDCARDGWLQMTRDGRFLFVGDSGDVIDVATGRTAGFIPALRNTRKFIEIDWRGSLPVATTSRYGLGYARRL